MKSTFSIFSFLLILLFSTSAYAQSVEAGKNLYQNEDYERALRIFTQIDTPEANLFSGKSYFSLGEFSKSKAYLNRVIDSDESTNIFVQEAKYTKALFLKSQNYGQLAKIFFD